jgi:hypothetical protein
MHPRLLRCTLKYDTRLGPALTFTREQCKLLLPTKGTHHALCFHFFWNRRILIERVLGHTSQYNNFTFGRLYLSNHLGMHHLEW